MPSNSIYLADVRGEGGHLTVGTPEKISTWKGYNNQPSFSADGLSILYVSYRDTQSDIYRYDIGSQSTSQVTKTRESEYSPQPMPGFPRFSVIRVEGDSTQRLWSFANDGTRASPVFPKQKGAGYYCWIDNSRAAMFVIGKNDTDSLKIVQLYDNPEPVIATNIGRCLQRVPIKGGLCYVQRKDDTTSFVEVYDLKAHKNYQLLKTLPGSQDFVWTKNDDIIMAKGSKLYICRPPDESKWTEFADFSRQGLKNITRLALNPSNDKIAIVEAEDQNSVQLSPLWTVHIDEVDRSNQSTFEHLCTEQASRRTAIYQRSGFFANPSYEFVTDDGVYYSMRSRSAYEELDHSPLYPDSVLTMIKAMVTPLDDSIHPALRFHHNELWTFDIDGSFVPAEANGHPLLLDNVRLHKDMVRPGMGDLYDSAIAMTRRAFVAAKLSKICISFYSSFGSGENMYVWFGKSKDDCDQSAVEEELQNNAEAWKEYGAAKDILGRCVLNSSDKHGVVRRDLNNLDSAVSFLGF
jgi:hypothetical protein